MPAPDEHDDRFDDPYPAEPPALTSAPGAWAPPSAAQARHIPEQGRSGRAAQPPGPRAHGSSAHDPHPHGPSPHDPRAVVEPGAVYDAGDPAGRPRGNMESARHIAWLLDDLVTIPGTKIGIGIDALIGLIPGIGDGVGTVLSGVILVEAIRQGVPMTVIVRMVLNLLLDAALGLLPGIGDVADAAHRANRKNMRLLEAAVADPERIRRTSAAYVLCASLVVGLTLLTLAAAAVFAMWVLWQALAAVF